MHTSAFLDYLEREKQDILANCTQCGKCVDVCPMPQYTPAVAQADPALVVGKVLQVLRTGEVTPEAKTWASSCSNSGCCIPACPEGVNPRKMLALTRLELRRQQNANDPRRAQQAARDDFKALGDALRLLLGVQLRPADIQRLLPGAISERQRPAEVVFYFGCNILRTPDIALTVLDVLDRLEVDYEVLGGTGNCCGVTFMRAGEPTIAHAQASQTLNNMAAFTPQEVLTWCPSCNVHMQDFVLEPETPEFPMRHVTGYLTRHLDALQRHFVHPVRKRVALHEHHGVDGVTEDVRRLLQAIPGVELVDIPQLADHAHQCTGMRSVPAAKENVHRVVLEQAAAAGVDVLADIYHSCHRELVAAESVYPFAIQNFISLVGEAMGLTRQDLYKRLTLYHDIEQVLAEAAPYMQANQVDTGLVQLALPKELWG
ncbi:MAG: (Fe-S)-binding protein [Candidatus Tectimicrobiota bacterium]